jgi:transposase
MWAGLYGVSARRRRELRSEWTRSDEAEVARRRDELALDGDALKVLGTWSRRCGDWPLARRILIVLNWADGWPPGYVAEALRCGSCTVHRTLNRYRQGGPAGLVDRRQDNGERKVDEDYMKTLAELVYGRPTDFRERRETWTQELLAKVAAEKTGVAVSISTMSRVLARIGARLGRPRPSVGCPWPRPRRVRRISELRKLIATLPPDEVAFWEDEVDVHLNPKVGPDWMMTGQQKDVPTPGKNQKRYIAGAIHAHTKKMTWVTGDRKASALFISLLWRLASQYRRYRVIHLILDNYIIHKSRITEKAVAAFGGRIKLHFLPPYCPNDNPIERVWRDFHANVTRNHRCRTMNALVANSETYLTDRNELLAPRARSKAA